MGAETESPPAADVLVVRAGDVLPRDGSFDVELEGGAGARVDGGEVVALAPGYHTLHDGNRAISLIVSPGGCFLPDELRVWGWAVQLYSVHSAASWGIGDLGDLRDIGRWAASNGAGALLLNPLHAAAPAQASPYFPSSRCFRNPIYIDVPAVAAMVSAEPDETGGRGLSATPTVERERVYRAKLQALESLWKRFSGARPFDVYKQAAGDSLADFATYVTIAEQHGWTTAEWPVELADPRSATTAEWQRQHRDRIDFHAWLQWILDEQLARAGDEIGIVHDLAIGSDPDGADAWVWKEAFVPGATIGAPPDEFAPAGQDWSMPPLDPWRLRALKYEPFIRTVRAGLSGGAGMRVDHVMGLFRLWWIPEGASASDGAYVRYPKDDLLNILALESHRARSYVIGEDLGTVEPAVREEMRTRRMLSYRVMYFEADPPERFPELALACVTNHDLPTIAGLWNGRDVEEQRSIGLSVDEAAEGSLRDRLEDRAGVASDATVEDVITGAYDALSRAPTRIKLATLEDASAADRRVNQPGTLDERPNWSLRLPLSIEQLRDAPLPKRIGDALSS